MFIELTDHLRCPADHAESFVVLLPEAMAGRSVVAGQLGCPVCGRTSRIERGEWAFGPLPRFGVPPDEGGREAELDAPALITLAGIQGPGGYVVLVGGTASLAAQVADDNPGIGLVAVNPPPGVVDDAPRISVLRGERLPLKTNSMRGVALGRGYGDDPHWIQEAARVTLPGLRVVGEGAPPPPEAIELMASAGGAWVGAKRRG